MDSGISDLMYVPFKKLIFLGLDPLLLLVDVVR